MPTTEELVKVYRNYNDDKLMECYHAMDSYTDEAKRAFALVLSEAGGLDALKLRLEEKNKLDNESSIVAQDAILLFKQGKSTAETKKIIKSDLLTYQQISDIVDRSEKSYRDETEDKRIKPRTLIGGIFGGFIGGTIGGALLAYQMIGSGRTFLILLFGLVVISYFFVWLFTRQSKRNIAVIIITIVASIYAYVLSQVIYGIYGGG